MSAKCQVTGRQPGFGKTVSHSHHRTSRRWNPNLQRRRFWLPSQNRYVTLRVSVKGLRTIDKCGIEAVVARIRGRGERCDRAECNARGLIHAQKPVERYTRAAVL
ncbi:50S ribosomal protein L28 [Fodinicola feengrottensis]|uniref:50S ribosomal protein L28 n=1 Tax=Fodinicola feengrottensis TaxID=435914 RepID=UPI0031D35D57